MKKQTAQPLIIFLVLLLLSITAFQVRLENFSKSTSLTIDEQVYYVLGRQLKNEFPKYNTIDFAHELKRIKDFEIPEYMFQSLFKHPPAFPFLISLSLRLFGENYAAAAYVAVFFGVLLIPLGYLLGQLLGGVWVGILAALLLWLDPVSVICSQKIWLDTMMTFFMGAAIYCYLAALKYKQYDLLVLSGLMTGFAALTKYPGIIVMPLVYAISAIRFRFLLKSWKFYVSLVIPLVMLLPWFYWNYQVYGSHFLQTQSGLHNFLPQYSRTILISGLVMFILALPWLSTWAAKWTTAPRLNQLGWSDQKMPMLKVATASALLAALWQPLLRGLSLTSFPSSSWETGLFSSENCLFYLGRVLEFSPVYFFAYLSYFSFRRNRGDNTTVVLKVAALTILIFFSMWGSYQSRYILPAIPFLLVLASHEWVNLFKQAAECQSFQKRIAAQAALVLVLSFALYKMFLVDQVMGFPNDLCYF